MIDDRYGSVQSAKRQVSSSVISVAQDK